MPSLWGQSRALLDDLRYAVRTLRRNTGFTVAAVLTLALGIGANTGVFSVVNGIILKPLPYSDPDRLVKVYVARPDRGWTRGSMSQPDLRSVQAEARSIQAAAGYYARELTLTGLGAAEHRSPTACWRCFRNVLSWAGTFSARKTCRADPASF
jgi:putative ABC transport system permease protein